MSSARAETFFRKARRNVVETAAYRQSDSGTAGGRWPSRRAAPVAKRSTWASRSSGRSRIVVGASAMAAEWEGRGGGAGRGLREAVREMGESIGRDAKEEERREQRARRAERGGRSGEAGGEEFSAAAKTEMGFKMNGAARAEV